MVNANGWIVEQSGTHDGSHIAIVARCGDAKLTYLEDPSINVTYLTLHGPHSSLDSIASTLEDSRYKMRTDEILDEFDDAHSDEDIIEAFKRLCLLATGEINDNVRDQLEEVIEHPSDEVRREAIIALSYLSWHAAEELLDAVEMADSNPEIRQLAADLWLMNQPESDTPSLTMLVEGAFIDQSTTGFGEPGFEGGLKCKMNIQVNGKYLPGDHGKIHVTTWTEMILELAIFASDDPPLTEEDTSDDAADDFTVQFDFDSATRLIIDQQTGHSLFSIVDLKTKQAWPGFDQLAVPHAVVQRAIKNYKISLREALLCIADESQVGQWLRQSFFAFGL